MKWAASSVLIIGPLSPCWRSRFLRHSIDRPLLQQGHCLLHGAFELRIASGNNVLGPVLHIDVRSDTFVFYRPLTVAAEEATTGCDHRSAINERWRIGCMDQTTPCALANEWANFPVPEHIGHQVAARAGHFVNDHHLRSPDTSRWTRKRESFACDVVEITIKVALQNIDDVIRC